MPDRSRLLAPLVVLSSGIGFAPPPYALTLDSAAALIKSRCDPSYLAAVQQTGRLLYRGSPNAVASILAPGFDLLLASTYQDSAALAYFNTLEREMPAAIKPSNSHIAVADIAAASQWGDVVSVWPLAKGLHYAFPNARRDFYPVRAAGNAPRAPVKSTSLGGADQLAIDRDLPIALRDGREVMFAASSFVAIRASADAEIKALLRVRVSSTRI